MPFKPKERAMFLDLFYDYYPSEYNYCYSNGIRTDELFEVLKETYPTEFAEIVLVWDEKHVR